MASGDIRCDAPQYILVGHSVLSSAALASSNQRVLTHPIIQYVYADDPPTAALPRFSGEQVIVVDYDDISGSASGRSLNSELAVTAIKASTAPGTDLMDQAPAGGSKMYVIETMQVDHERPNIEVASSDPNDQAQSALRRYKQRNETLRAVMTSSQKPPTTTAIEDDVMPPNDP